MWLWAEEWLTVDDFWKRETQFLFKGMDPNSRSTLLRGMVLIPMSIWAAQIGICELFFELKTQSWEGYVIEVDLEEARSSNGNEYDQNTF